jgi:phosphomannomutase
MLNHNFNNTIILFDIDGTLTDPRKKIDERMLETLSLLKNKYTIGCVGGSDITKAKEQVGENILKIFNYGFFENGLMAYKGEELLHLQSLKQFLGEEKIKSFVNFVLKYIADLDIPIKRGTFIEFRNGMINVSPIGRNCSQDERDEFEKYDHEHKIREKMITKLREEFGTYNLNYSIGGQISFDVFPNGWDKTYCLQFLNDFKNIYFFGDKTDQGGNDHEIYESEKTIGYKTKGFDKTIQLLNEHFL